MPDFGKYTVHPVADKFPLLDAERFAELVADIKTYGQREPILLAPDGTIIVDGRNRYLACTAAEIEPRVETLGKKYTEAKIIELIASKNLQRRDLEAGQRMALAVICNESLAAALAAEAKERQDEGRQAGGKKAGRGRPNRSGPTSGQSNSEGRTNRQVGKKLGVAHSTVSQANAVNRHSRRLIEQVASGKKSLNEAYREARQAKQRDAPKEKTAAAKSNKILTLVTHLGEQVPYPLPKAAAKFNETNEQVDWARFTWNPVTGCLHGCPYCYAREMAEVRASYRDAYPVGFTPLFHHERLDAPKNTPVPDKAQHDPRFKRCFVCSMADLYGKWVPDEWIEQVHKSCIANPQWDYLFLTKFPRRYVGMQLPPTAWLGTSVDEQKRVRLAEEAFAQIKDVRVKWLSLEPLLAPLEFKDLSMFDWIVIGAQSATEQPGGLVKEFAPDPHWVLRLVDQAHEAGCKVYCKHNLFGNPNPQSPGVQWPQEEPFLTNGADHRPAQEQLAL